MSSAAPAAYATPAEILSRRRRAILDGDAEGFAALFTADAVIEVPFAGSPDAPVRMEGRQRILDYARRVMASPLHLEDFEVTALHHTQDSDVLVVEMRTRGTVGATGRAFTVTSVQILHFRDGLIALFRDYADPRVAEEALADLDHAPSS
jgi:uncharacterized protein